MHLRKLLSFVILILLLLVVLNDCKAQLLHTPSFIDNTLVNSPASLGAIQQEGIHLSMFSYRSEFRFLNLSNLRDVLSNSDRPLIAPNVKRFFSLSYYNTQILSNNSKITVGLQLQNTNLNTAQIYSPNTYGVTINYHKTLDDNDRLERFFSCGVQMNLIHQKPRRFISSFTFNNLISSPTIDLDAFHKQLSKTGFQFTVNFSWLRYKPKRSVLVVGASGSSAESKIANSFGGTTTGSFTFDSELNYNGHLFFNGQFTSGGRFMLDFNILAGFNHSASSIGLGFKLKKNKIMRITAVTVIYDSNIDRNTDRGLVFTYEASKFSYNLHITSPLENNFSFSKFDSTIQIGAVYKMSQDGYPTLLDRKY